MFWAPMLAMSALGALQGAQQRKAQQEQNQQAANINAAQTEYSPWTGIKPGAFQPAPVTSTALGGALSGGLSGAMFGKQFGDGTEDNPNPTQDATTEMQDKNQMYMRNRGGWAY